MPSWQLSGSSLLEIGRDMFVVLGGDSAMLISRRFHAVGLAQTAVSG